MHRLAIVLVLLGAFAAPAHAADCAPLTRILSLDLAPAPGGGPRFGVPVTVNGTARLLVLNTAARVSRVTSRLVTALKLSPRSAGKMLALNGNVSNGYIVTVDLGIGPALLKDTEMRVEQNAGPFDGEFGADLMGRYDIELDIAGRKLNYFSPEHCDGQVISWPNAASASVAMRGWGTLPANTAAMRRTGMTPIPESLTIPVSLDGHEVMATVNTGVAETTLDADTARQLFGLTPDSPGAVPLGTMDGNASHRVFGYGFKTLAIGGLVIAGPRVRVIPDLLGSKSSETLTADSHIQRRTDDRLPALRLGLDVLRRLHLYIAGKEQKLYLTLASDVAPNPAP